MLDRKTTGLSGAMVLGLVAVAPSIAETPTAKNIILMISDGAGDTTWRAANMWQSGNATFAPDWQTDVAYNPRWMTTFPGHTQPVPPSETGGILAPRLFAELDAPQFGSYDPIAANDDTPADVLLVDNNGLLGRGTPVALTPVPGLPPEALPLAQAFAAGFDIVETPGFAAYQYLVTQGVTDSAAAGTALASGVKSYNSAINVGLDMQPVPFITQTVKAEGKAAGVVTTKAFTDATPAAFGTQNVFRRDEANISDDMIRNGLLDVIISPGHPEFGSPNTPRATPDFDTVSETNLVALRDGSLGWSFVDDPATLQAIADGTAAAPDRLFGLLPVGGALNSRDTAGRTNAYDPDTFDPANPNGAVPFVMPDLTELTAAALNTLQQDDDGLFLMVEGASVDSAAHANDLPRLIEEQLAFNRAVEEVIDWVEAESSWDETLLIVTTDHANALLLGPDSATEYMQDPQPTAAGELPEAIWWSTNHTNELVPLWSRGPGSALFDALIDGTDPRRGTYVDNTDVFTVMNTVVPEPGLLGGLAAAGVALLRRRRAA